MVGVDEYVIIHPKVGQTLMQTSALEAMGRLSDDVGWHLRETAN
jgi:hypothetical protein